MQSSDYQWLSSARRSCSSGDNSLDLYSHLPTTAKHVYAPFSINRLYRESPVVGMPLHGTVDGQQPPFKKVYGDEAQRHVALVDTRAAARPSRMLGS